MAIQPGNERYRTLLNHIVLATTKLNWLLGDTALELAPDDPRDPVLNQFIEDLTERGVNITRDQLLFYRRVARIWPLQNRVVGCSWKVHAMLTSEPLRIKPGMTVTEAHRALGHSTAGRTGPESTAAARAAQAAQALRDPDIARRVAQDPAARRNMSRATGQHHQEQQTVSRGRRAADPVTRNLDQRDVVIALGQACEHFARAVQNGISQVDGVPESERPWLESAVSRAGAAYQVLQAFLDTGQTRMDAELQALLEGRN